jgi:ArsR family transcriptional regulator, arsenate/arsenite/antimonite-responsive transcriptional repressor
MAKADKLTKVFRALSVETRVRIVQLLKERALCVNALAARLGVTSAAVSQHLRVLRDADLVVPDRRGYHVHYLINEKTLAAWRDMADSLLGTDTE